MPAGNTWPRWKPLLWWTTPELQEADPEGFDATLAWIRSLGLDPNDLLPVAAVVEHDGQCELHVDRCVKSRDGKHRLDPLNEDELLTERVILIVARDSWPTPPEDVA